MDKQIKVSVDDWMMNELSEMAGLIEENVTIPDYNINLYDSIQEIWETDCYLNDKSVGDLSEKFSPTLKGVKVSDISIEDYSKFQLGMLVLISTYDYNIWDMGQMFRNQETFFDTLHKYGIEIDTLYSKLKHSLYSYFELFFNCLFECVTFSNDVLKCVLSIKALLEKLSKIENNAIHIFCCFSLVGRFCALNDMTEMMKIYHLVKAFNVGVKPYGS